MLHHPLPRAAFDLVIIAYLQLAAADLASVLHRAVAALAPSGTILVVGHDRADLDRGVGGPQDPAVLHTPEQVVADLDALTNRRAETTRRPVHVDGGTIDALDTLVVATRTLTTTYPWGYLEVVAVTKASLPDLLRRVTGVLAVVAHPDDESFALGAVLSKLVMNDAHAGLICFTHGEASTLHGRSGRLFTVRSQELQAAGAELRLSPSSYTVTPTASWTRSPSTS